MLTPQTATISSAAALQSAGQLPTRARNRVPAARTLQRQQSLSRKEVKLRQKIKQDVFSWRFDYESYTGNVNTKSRSLKYEKETQQITISDNSEQPQANENCRKLKQYLEDLYLKSGKSAQINIYDTKQGYSRKVIFNINDIDQNKLEKDNLLSYYFKTKDLEQKIIDEIVQNLIHVIINIDQHRRGDNLQKIYAHGIEYFKIPILQEDEYPPLAMFLDSTDGEGEISMGVGCNGGMSSNQIMNNIVENIVDKVKKHSQLRKYFYSKSRRR